MLDLTYHKCPESNTVEVTGTIPVTNVIQMMSQDRATRFLCHALMNIIKGHDLEPMSVNYRMAYITELLHNEDDYFEGTESFNAFQISTVNQFIEMVEQNCGKEATEGMRAYNTCDLRDDVPRLQWLRQVHEKNPNAVFKIDILCSTDGFHSSILE
jgi:hypothetical protein